MLKRIGRYINLQPMDAGGMGQVYLAEHELLPGTFVVKVLNPAMAADPEAIERFKRECIILSAIRHPNIVHCLEPGEEGGTWFLPMEWVRGETLQKKIDQAASIPVKDRLGWAAQVLSGLEAAHGAKPRPIIHRDLKPSNIMVTPDGVVKVLDFGIAHEAGSKLTRAGNPGTPEFQAPEQIKNGGIDARTDLFALGIVLYMLFTGRHPFKPDPGQSEFETLNAIINHEPPPPTDIDPRLPEGLNTVLLRVLKKKPEERFASAREMRLALETLYAAGQGAEDQAREFSRRQLDRARQLIEIGGAENVNEAAKFVATACALASDDPEALALRERVKTLRAEFERLEVLFDKAQRALQAKQFVEARSCLDLALSIRPEDSRLRRLRAELDASESDAGAGGETAPGVAAGAGAAGPGASRPGDARLEARLQRAMDLVRSGDRAAAGAALEELLDERPGDLWVLDAAYEAGFEPEPPRRLSWPADELEAAALATLTRLERDLARAEEELRGGAVAGAAETLAARIDAWHRILDGAALSAPLAEREAALRARVSGIETRVAQAAGGGAAGGGAVPADLLRAWEAS